MPPTWSTFDKIAVAYNHSLALACYYRKSR